MDSAHIQTKSIGIITRYFHGCGFGFRLKLQAGLDLNQLGFYNQQKACLVLDYATYCLRPLTSEQLACCYFVMVGVVKCVLDIKTHVVLQKYF